MTNPKQRIDKNQQSLFDYLTAMSASGGQDKSGAGSMDLDRQFRAAVSSALKSCPRSRWEVCARMSELTGHEITKTMLDSWTAESKEDHRFPAIFLPAFCLATGCSDPLSLLSKPVGVFVMPGPEALRAEIRRLEEDIEQKQADKRKRLIFLKEMEAKG